MKKSSAVQAVMVVFGAFVLVMAGCQSAGSEAEWRKPIMLKINESVQLETVTIMATEVTSDSRCPKDVTCVWAGDVSVALEATIEGQESESFTLTTPPVKGKNVFQLSDVQIELLEVNPYPKSEETIAQGDYEIMVQMNRNAL